jgi:N-formylglutamate deformylase
MFGYVGSVLAKIINDYTGITSYISFFSHSLCPWCLSVFFYPDINYQMELFTVHEPTTKPIPLIANLPHSGLYIPQQIASQLSEAYLPNQDWHLNKLYDFLPQLGITVLQANYSRYVVDLNRAIQEPLAGNFWSCAIPLQTAFGQPIYKINPSKDQLKGRIPKFYSSYHNKLEELLKEKIAEFGKVYLLDLHSFGGLIDDQICLGNLNGQSCSDFLISTVEECFTNKGLQVVKNKTFTGGFITKNYSQTTGVEALQIEVRYNVYLDLQQLDKQRHPDWNVPEFYQAKSIFQEIFSCLVKKIEISQ